MASSTEAFVKSFVVALLSAALAVPAMAQQAARCEGTLCDLYYGANGNNPPAQTGVPAGATPLTVPNVRYLGDMFGGGSQQPAASTPGAPPQAGKPGTPLVAVGGGGLVGMARGAPQERCGGSLCDLLYGGPSPEEQREAQRADHPEAPQPTRTALAPAAAPAPDDEPRATRRRDSSRDRGKVEYARAPAEKPSCVAPPGDPWKCFRK